MTLSRRFFLHLMGDEDVVHYDDDNDDEEDDDNATINCWQKIGTRI